MTANPTDPVGGTAFSGSTGSPSRRRIALVLGGATILIVAATATSLAAPNAPAGPSAGSTLTVAGDAATEGDAAPGHGRFGRAAFRDITIESISGNDVSLATADGWRRTITISSSVELTQGGQTITVGDLKVGDQVRFRQTRNDDGSFTVTALAVVVPTVHGTASDITSSGFKVTTRDGSVWTVTVNDQTTYGYGQGSGSLSDVTAGEPVRVAGTITADNQMTATNVRVAGDRAVGRVTAKTADTITLERRDGSTVTVHVDGDTTFRVAGVEDADLADMAVDMAIGVTGRARANGSIDADAVAAGNLRGLGRRGLDRDGERFRGPAGFDLPALDLPGFDLPGLDLPGLDEPASDDALAVPTA